MNWPEAIAYTLVGIGLVAGAFLFARRPSFWIEFGVRIFEALLPAILKRKSAEDEAKWRRDQLTKPNPQPMPSRHPKRDR